MEKLLKLLYTLITLQKYLPEEVNLYQNEIKTKLNNLKSVIKKKQIPLDHLMTQNELTDKLKTLKSREACGTDCIKNKMLKTVLLNYK